MSNRKRQPEARVRTPNNERLFELASLVVDDRYAFGPQDQQDLREALIELLAHRNANAAHSAPVPEVQAA